MNQFLQTLFGVSEVKLTEVQQKISHLPKDRNVLILSSCGSGKTEAAYYLALQWGGRILYIQPQRTLATSIYERLKKYHSILGYSESWTIQHSALQEDPFLTNRYVVTTIDQVLAGYLGIGVQAFMKGKHVVQSHFIFDEIQLFEPGKTLKTTIQMLDALYKRGNRFIIMTATMPEYLMDFLGQRYQMEVIVTKQPSVKNRKVTVQYIESLDWAAINNYPGKQIILCNTQKEQVEVYQKINDPTRCIILNSKLLPKDREEAERKVLQYFGKGSGENNKTLISTQVIEAGMDISAPRMYSSISPIDSLIQRDGRVARWGGEGELICFKGDYQGVYDEEVVIKTIDALKKNQSIEFTWDIQKQWVNEILNPYYRKHINEREIKKHKPKLKDGSRNELIRGIENVNIIVDPSPSFRSFQKAAISVHINQLEKIAKSNQLYGLHRGEIRETPYSEINVGDTIVIKGNDCLYDEVGFRMKEGKVCVPFPESHVANNKEIRADYKEEPWILHALAVKDIMKEKLEKEHFSEYVIKNQDQIVEIAGLHDLGKLDVVWQGPLWANAQSVPLAHFPLKKGNPSIFKERNHAVISAHLLRPYTDFIQMNMVLQHHKRFISDGTCVHLREYELDQRYKQCLDEYGFSKPLKERDKNRDFTYEHDIITPAHQGWVEFLYLVGTLMEADIEAIQQVQGLL
ncbi:CRISPR-associated helicase Cas3' [Anoxybacteroides tepidamans]|uniref:CRISPR-associated helicase Cas3' n=1 Tax=Anoxybacteroides tepidamans TaxID=265948 RepID=UPI0004822512|nr:CRISPR-associated helicase Cas3' [Anoxybacillus tepidamans]